MKVLGRGSVAAFIKTALDIAGVLFLVGAVCAVAATLGYGALFLAVKAGVAPATVFAGGIDNRAVAVHFAVQFDPWQVELPGLLGAVVMTGGGLIVIRRLKALFQSFTSGNPFARENAAHLRTLWIALAGIELGRYAVAALTGVLVMTLGQPNTAHVSVGVKVDLMAWFMIAVVVVLAEVFREGARLKEEQELTI